MALKLPSVRVNKTWLMLLVAVGLALLATVLTAQYLKSREAAISEEVAARTKQGGPKLSVAVAIKDLPVGTPLDQNLVAARNVSEDLLYPDAILADDFEKFKGQALIRPVLHGRPLLRADLRPMYADFAGTLIPGTRAMTIDVDELNSVAHMVQPGNLIDLMLVMKRDDGGDTVVPFMDKMKVLATGQKIIQDGSDERSPTVKKGLSYSNFTLEVTPTQAARLTLAQNLGKLRFTLRNEKDIASEDFSVNSQNIFDEVTARANRSKSRQAGATGTVEYIVGGQRNGPSAKSVDMVVPVGGAAPIVPSLSGKSSSTMSSSGASPYDSNGMTPEMKTELKALLDKPQ
jgi:pilus assembly protein CpaB